MAASRMDLQSCCLLLVLLFTVALAINREKVGMMMVMVVMMVMVMIMMVVVMIGRMIMRIAGSTLIDYKYTLIKEKRSIIAIKFRVLLTSFLDSPCISTKMFNLKAESTQMDICMFVAYRSARAISFKAFHLFFTTVALSMFC